MGCRIRAAALVAALAAVLVASCTSDAARPSPTPTRSTVPTGSTLPTDTTPTAPTPTGPRTGPLTTGPNVRPGESPPEYPALAKRHTAMGALAFAVYYYRAFDWGYATNDPYLVKTISSPRCEGCRKYIDGLRSVQRSSATLRGGRVTVLQFGLRHGQFNYRSDHVARVVVDEDPVLLIEPDGRQKRVARGVTSYPQYVFVSWSHGRWVVVEVAGE